jgi:hypothetical protein
MSLDFATSNLSKISTKFRTSGAISQPRRKAGSPLNAIGITKTKVVKIVNKNDYLNRLYLAYESTNDIKLKKFIHQEIKKILIQQGLWSKVFT